MGKSLFIAEKPSVAQAFAGALGETMKRGDGFLESDHIVVTWCVGHLISMSYPEAYGQEYRKWSFSTLPFIPDRFRYEVIRSSAKQFATVKKLLTRPDVEKIYVCTDSGREGEYIYRLVRQEAGVKDKEERRVWIDSQTDEEILRGVREAKPISAYDTLSDAAYLRAKEDYLMGINFSRALTLRYGDSMASFLKERYCVISVGRVMTCVLGMIVSREREIRQFQETAFYRVFAVTDSDSGKIQAEWRAVEGSAYFQSPKLYKENGWKEKKDAELLIERLSGSPRPWIAKILEISRKNENKNPPLLYNLAELQNDCSRMFKISPDQTLSIAQELYEKKLTTYPRTDARVLSSAIAKEIGRNLQGLARFAPAASFAKDALERGSWKTIAKTRYVNDAQITDHYAIIPTGQTQAVNSLSSLSFGVYCQIVKRFLGIFYPPAKYRKISLTLEYEKERFFASFRILQDEGYLAVMKKPSGEEGAQTRKTAGENGGEEAGSRDKTDGPDSQEDAGRMDPAFFARLEKMRKGGTVTIDHFEIREGRTSPPKRYNSGSIILAMENAGQLIEDEELREQIRTTGIGTSSTRAEILKKLEKNQYISLNKKTQILTPTLLGEMICDVVSNSISVLLSPAFTASWEKGLNYVVDGSVSSDEYMEKLSSYVAKYTNQVKETQNVTRLLPMYQQAAQFYKDTNRSADRTAAEGGKKTRKSSGKAAGRTAGRTAGRRNPGKKPGV